MPASDERIQQIKANIVKMGQGNASPEQIDAYIASEGVTKAELKANPIQPKTTLRESAEQALIGLSSGLFQGTVGLPGSIAQFSEWGGRKAGKAINLGLEKLGALPPGYAEKTEQEYLAGMEQMYPGFMEGTVAPPGLPTARAVQKAYDLRFPNPVSETAKSVRRGTEILGSAVVPVAGAGTTAAMAGAKVAPAMLRAGLNYGVIPAAASEAAGIGTKFLTGSEKAAEYARLIGALGGGVAGTVRELPTKSEKLVSSTLANATDSDFAAAQALMAASRARGVNITAAEALASVTGGKVDPTRIQQVVERVEPGARIMNPFIAERTEQTRRAVEKLKSNISPTPGSPATMGKEAADIAKAEIGNVRKGINAETQALYQSGEKAVLPSASYNRMLQNPLFVQLLNDVRKTPVYAGELKGIPSTSVKVLDVIKKRANDLASEAADAGKNDLASRYGSVSNIIDDEISAVIKSAEANAIRTNTPIPANAQRLIDYSSAIERQAALRAERLDPAKASMLGDVERAGRAKSGVEATQKAAKAVMPKAPTEGQQVAVADTLGVLAKSNPDLARQLVRFNIDKTSQKYLADLVSGPNQFGGAGFANELAGSPQKLKNFVAAVKAVTDGRTAEEASKIIDILKATGMRRRPGSDTAFNTELIGAMKEGEGWKAVVQTLSRPLEKGIGRVASAAEERQFRQNAERLAQVLTSPDGVKMLQSLGPEASKKTWRALGNFLLSQAASSPTTDRGLIVDVYPRNRQRNPQQPGLLGE